MMSLLKNNIFGIVLFVIFAILAFIINWKISSIKKENETMKAKLEQNDSTIELLNKNMASLEQKIELLNKQRQIEEELIDKKQEVESEAKDKKEDIKQRLDYLEDTNEEVKNWCDEPIPSDVSTLFILGLQ